ncbi:MAG: DUF1015 domain-containing protein [Deltaproteobacteria bacterium]|nr:DUF1015 domain-containing protein [Deltaproteobacteria bacterium]
MAFIMPFRGIRYDTAKVGNIEDVVSPPYDVISPEFQEELYLRHPNNIVRLILGKTNPGDAPGRDRYSRAAEYFGRWQKDAVLIRDEAPSIYYYIQGYKFGKREKTRKGFIALLRLEEFGKGSIYPHEKTLSGPKADRLNLMKACSANLCPVFSLYPESPEEKGRITGFLFDAGRGDPLMDVKGGDGVANKLWRIDNPEVIKKVTDSMRDKKLFIADGHHRYETALNYRNLMTQALKNPMKNPTGEEPFNYVMMYFASMDDEGLEIFPTHRVAHSLSEFKKEGFLKECGRYFSIEESVFDKGSEASVRDEFARKLCGAVGDTVRFGLVMKGVNAYYLLTLKGRGVMDGLFPDMAGVYKTLDVTVLHSVVLTKILGISPCAQEKQENLLYVKDINEAVEKVRSGKGQLAFLMNPTKVEDVKRVCEAGLLMPQKSTYFYPKLLSGLVINPLWDI